MNSDNDSDGTVQTMSGPLPEKNSADPCINWRSYLGIPFLNKGRDLNGCDCWGLVVIFYRRELGIELPGYENLYRDTNHIRGLVDGFTDHSRDSFFQASFDQEQIGDVVIIQVRGLPLHVGIYCGRFDGRASMLHVMQSRGQSYIEPVHNPMMPGRYPTFWRHRDR